MAIDNLYDLSNTVTSVANRALELATENTTTGQWVIEHDDVADFISEEDYLLYFDFIANELAGRIEVLDLETHDNTLDMVCGYAWCKNYEPAPGEAVTDYGYEELRPAPSMAHLAEIAEESLKHIVREGLYSRIDEDEFGITEEDLNYTRVILDDSRDDYEKMLKMSPLAPFPLTNKEYEDILCSSITDPDSFSLMANRYGQIVADKSTQEQNPEAIAVFNRYFSASPVTDTEKSGYLIHGEPVIMLSHTLEPHHNMQNTDEDKAAFHAQTRMIASQLSAILSTYNAKISCGFNTGERGHGDELIAIVPACAEKNRLDVFEKSFRTNIDRLPLSPDFTWVKSNYEKALQESDRYIKDFMNRFRYSNLSPWLPQMREHVAIAACGQLGEYLGTYQRDWEQARTNHDTKRLESLHSRSNFLTNDELFDRCMKDATYSVYDNLTKFISLHMDNENPEFSIRKGELMSLLPCLGYEKNYPLRAFLESYSPELVQDIKELTQEGKKSSLTAKIQDAEKRSQSIGTEGIKETEREL